MHLPEFILLVAATIAAIAAGLAMIASNYRVARVLFWIAAITFGSMGVVWSANSTAPLWLQLVVSGVVGAIAAIGLAWGLYELRGKQSIEEHKSQTNSIAILESSSGGEISARGANIPGSLPNTFGRADTGGKINLDGITVKHVVDAPKIYTQIERTQTIDALLEWRPYLAKLVSDLTDAQVKFISYRDKELPPVPRDNYPDPIELKMYQRFRQEALDERQKAVINLIPLQFAAKKTVRDELLEKYPRLIDVAKKFLSEEINPSRKFGVSIRRYSEVIRLLPRGASPFALTDESERMVDDISEYLMKSKNYLSELDEMVALMRSV